MKRLLTSLLAAALGLAAAIAQAQDYPSRPIKVLVPFAPGGAVDTTTRILTAKLTERLGWQFVVENRPGGNGFIAVTAAAKSPADGYTLLMAHTGEFSVNPALFANVPYDLDRDFIAVSMVSDAPMLYLANANAPFSTFRELVALAKEKPGHVTFSSPGNGSINHLAGEWLGAAAGVKLMHVPYKGGAPAATAVATGEVMFGVMAIPGAAPHMQSKKAKVIGVTTAKRTAAGPDWPTPQEGGVPDVDASIWVGLFAPKGTPATVIDRLNAEIRKTLEQPEVRARYADLGSEVAGNSPAAFAERIRKDLARYREVVKAGGVKVE